VVRRIYLDHNASAPLRAEALEACLAAARLPGNPSSAHEFGQEARDRLEQAREQVAALSGARAPQIVFTSGATEANATVLRAALRSVTPERDTLVTCATEHPSILAAAESLRGAGLRVVALPVGGTGHLAPAAFARALDGGRALLASVMWANNETGVIQPIAELAEIAASRGVPFHTDAAQALGRVPVDLAAAPIDFASLSAHKLGGPKGIGAVFARDPDSLASLLVGGLQERGRRAGTENLVGAAGFGAACEAAGSALELEAQRLSRLRDRLAEGIAAKVSGTVVHAVGAERLPQTLSIGFPNTDGEALVQALDLAGVAVSLGAACASGSLEPSHVLLAMGVPRALAAASLRFSLGFDTREDEIERVLDLLPVVVERVRAESRS
jgi:cysteine desulfurase